MPTPHQASSVPPTPAIAAISSPSVSSCCTRSTTARPDRQAHGDLAPAHARPCKQQAGDVDAGHEQHATSGGEQDERRLPDDRIDAGFVKRDRHSAPHVVVRPVADESWTDRRELRIRLLKADAVLQPRNSRDEILRRRLVVRVVQARGHRRCDPDFRLAAQAGESVGQNADDRQRHVVDDQRAADRRWDRFRGFASRAPRRSTRPAGRRRRCPRRRRTGGPRSAAPAAP